MTDKLTDKAARKLEAPALGNRIAYDDEVKGSGVRVTSAGAKVFVLNSRAVGRERRLTIGSFPDWQDAAARQEAEKFKRLVDQGLDPMADRHAGCVARTIDAPADRLKAGHLPKRWPGIRPPLTLGQAPSALRDDDAY